MRLRIEWPRHRRVPYPLAIKLTRGQGAGYIGGWTAYVALGCHAPTRDGYGIRRLQAGITRNANTTPTFPWSRYVETRVVEVR